MGNGEMVSTNSTTDLNYHRKMVKKTLINGDMVKSQVNISFPKKKSTHLFLPDYSQI